MFLNRYVVMKIPLQNKTYDKVLPFKSSELFLVDIAKPVKRKAVCNRKHLGNDAKCKKCPDLGWE